MNLIEKLHALLVSDEVNIWHFPSARQFTPDAKPFVYWLVPGPRAGSSEEFDTLEEMIEAAYAHIDPLRKPLPAAAPPPPSTPE